MSDDYAVLKNILVESLEELSDHDYQERIWTNKDNPNGYVASFTEAVINIFDDAVVINPLREGEILFDQTVTQALWELHDATTAVDDNRPPEEIINDPLMKIVRQKAAKALKLVTSSDGLESTVEIID